MYSVGLWQPPGPWPGQGVPILAIGRRKHMIGLYYGTSLLSRVIEFRTWSAYSHASWIDENDPNWPTIEAWSGGVSEWGSVHDNHAAGTRIDLFVVRLTSGERQGLEAFLRSQFGKLYDFWGLLNFLTRRPERPQDQEKWFCSELVFAAFEEVKRPLLARIQRWKVSPGLLSYSPLLEAHGGMVTKGGIE